ncbi:MAG: hypothetical protein ABFS09_11400 [Thermodesulfobacteriota bacterium]
MLQTQTSPAVNLVGFSDIKRDPIGGWQEFLQEGNQFLATATNAYSGGRQAFTSEILYNLVAMAIEKLIMALLMKSGNLPYNHTMHDLVESMGEFLPGGLAGLGEELKSLDAFQEICDVDSYTITPPTMAEVAGMLELAGEVQALTTNL